MSKEIDLRFTVEDDVNIAELMNSIGMGLESVLEIVQLENDGFGHLVPNEGRHMNFLMGKTK